MELTDHEKAMLDGAEGPAVQQAMRLLTRYGKALGAERLVETNNVAGGSVGSLPNRRNVIKDTDSMEAIFSLMNLDSDVPLEIPRVKTMAYKLIEAGDPDYYDKQRVSERAQKLIEKNAKFCDDIGIQRCNTCTPYQVGNVPTYGEHLAWMESSAVIYANSIVGARTNVEGAQSTAAAMLTARIPYWGLHVPENRYATHHVTVECEVESMMHWGLMGYYIGEQVQEASPVLTGLQQAPDLRRAKHFGAAAATSGGVEMYHLVGMTPEAPTLEQALRNKPAEETFRFGREEMEIAYKHLNTATDPNVDFIMLGCPHASIEQVRIVARLIEGKRVSENTELWMFTPKALKAHADRMGYTEIIEGAGGQLMSDTCPALGRVHPEGVKVAATDSCKQAHYLPATLGFDTYFGSVEDCVQAAIDGRWTATLQ
ncbi:MAG: aconitase X catalytic domain-containing protein [Pseudomonadota bacterium]